MHTVQLLRAFERRFVIFIIGKKKANLDRPSLFNNYYKRIEKFKTVLGLFSLAYDYDYQKIFQ